jgi:hypothetical protein
VIAHLQLEDWAYDDAYPDGHSHRLIEVAVAVEDTAFVDTFPEWTHLACLHVFQQDLETLSVGGRDRQPWSATPDQARRIRQLATEMRMSAMLAEVAQFGGEPIGL